MTDRQETMEEQHKRRVRYAGTHPRRFEEKYKEHDPEKYADTVAKVMNKGSTPAGMHIPIMVEEILEVLKISPGERGLDATLGYGGHSRKMLEGPLDLRLDPEHGVSAARRLRELTVDEFEGMLVENSDEPYAARIAAEVHKRLRRGMPCERTGALDEIAICSKMMRISGMDFTEKIGYTLYL